MQAATHCIQEESIPEEKLKRVTGGGAFDDVPCVEEHEYDDDTKKMRDPLQDTADQPGDPVKKFR